ncbi:hypothetical protein UJ101_02002 [Flavobacteriaceae bacterium UJ101]|nr:hypothetical protein UJ101_02002 [Flavobacteriaceae bacterium UJ101]
MKKMLTMLCALTLISIFHSCQDEELEVQTVSVNPVEQEIIEETPLTLDEIDDVLLVSEYSKLNSLSKTILKEKLATLYSDKVDLIDWDSVRLNTDYIYLEDQTTDSKIYRFLIDIPRVESDGDFIPPLVNLRVNYDTNNDDLISDLHINEEGISEVMTFNLEGTITNEISNDVMKSSARNGGSSCTICWVVRDARGITSRINWVTSSSSLSIGGGGYSPTLSVAPAAVWLQYARKTGNSQILSAFGIVRVAGLAWNQEITAKYINPPSRTHTTNDLYIVGSDPDTFSPFTTRYFYYFPELRGLITNFYNKGWVSYINSYISTTNLPYNQHIRRQTFIDSFMSWSYNVQRQNGNLFQYLSNNPNAMEKIFNLFAQYHLDNRDTMLTVGYNPGANYSSNKDVRFASWLSSYLLNNNIDLIKAYVDGNISQSQLESIGGILVRENNEVKELNSIMLDLILKQDTKLTYSELIKNYESIRHSHFKANGEPYFDDYCAINLSHALLKSGVKINSSNVAKCYGCTDVNYKGQHAIRAQELGEWLKIKKINGLSAVKELTGSNFRAYVNGKKGLIYFEDYWQRNGESGSTRTGDHVDIWTGNGLVSESWLADYFRLNFPNFMEEYFSTASLYRSKKVYFWELED